MDTGSKHPFCVYVQLSYKHRSQKSALQVPHPSNKSLHDEHFLVVGLIIIPLSHFVHSVDVHSLHALSNILHVHI